MVASRTPLPGPTRGSRARARYPAFAEVRRFVAWSTLVALTLSACSGVASTPTRAPSPAPSVASLAIDGSAGILSVSEQPLRLVTLGDSYTAGTYLPVARRDSWPAQLVQAMQGDLRLELVANVAEPGHTSGFVLDDQLWSLGSYRPDVVTLLVGANDVIAPGLTMEDYRRNVGLILDQLLTHLPPTGIFVITTPDFTLARRGGEAADRARMAAEVDEANAILGEEAQERGIALIDITPISDRVTLDPSLVIDDGPWFDPEGDFLPSYPSAKQYSAWVEVIGPVMRRVVLGAEP